MAIKKVTYVEPDDYFSKEALKIFFPDEENTEKKGHKLSAKNAKKEHTDENDHK